MPDPTPGPETWASDLVNKAVDAVVDAVVAGIDRRIDVLCEIESRAVDEVASYAVLGRIAELRMLRNSIKPPKVPNAP